MSLMFLLLLEKLQWWHLLILAATLAVWPVFRAVAVILVAKFVNDDIAKLAIPLVLHPLRPSFFSGTKKSQPDSTDKRVDISSVS
jgi:hypothetical protein